MLRDCSNPLTGHRRSKLPQGPRSVKDVFLKAQNISDHSTIYLLAHPSSSFCNLSLFLTLHRWQHHTRATIRCPNFTWTISFSITTAPPISLSSPPSHAAASSHATSPAPSTIASRMTSPAVNSFHLSDHDSEPGLDIKHVPVVDPDSEYEPAVGLQSPSPPLPVHGQPLRGQ